MPCPSSEKRFVILNGGEAGARDRTTADSLDDVDGTSSLRAVRIVSSTALPLLSFVRSLGGLAALLRMTKGMDWQ
jgi:hypothetical protein